MPTSNHQCEASKQTAFETALDYTVRFWPRFLTYAAQLNSIASGNTNGLFGPVEPMGPEYKAVVAINVDTLYTSSTMDLTLEPLVLTLPPYPYTYSMILVNGFGTVLDTNLEPIAQGATYALCGPDFCGTLVTGMVQVKVPVNWVQMAIRTDKYYRTSSGYLDVTSNADYFRQCIRLLPLSSWFRNPNAGYTTILPLSDYGTSVKAGADLLINVDPFAFYKVLVQALASPSTAPLSASDLKLICEFNKLFYKAQTSPNLTERTRLTFQLSAGGRQAWQRIINRWSNYVGCTNWIHFKNFGDWKCAYLDRAAGNEYIQYGNNASAAYYADTFVDSEGRTLSGLLGSVYTITFSARNIPQSTRFWSVTAYNEEFVELIDNPANKYAVASYTPGLVTACDGSITIYVSQNPPSDPCLIPNWLPVGPGIFSMLLRVYGPLGLALSGNYVPPLVVRVYEGVDPQVS
jgi:hypothetical protein